MDQMFLRVPNRAKKNWISSVSIQALATFCFCCGIVLVAPSFAQEISQSWEVVRNPPAAVLSSKKRDVPVASLATAEQPTIASAIPPNLFGQQGEVAWTAYIRKVDGQIYNPQTG